LRLGGSKLSDWLWCMGHGRMEYGVAGKRTQDYGSNPF
jgi:hypothetical protein